MMAHDMFFNLISKTESPKNIPIEVFDAIISHGLAGLVYSEFKAEFENDTVKRLYPHWKTQWAQNAFHYEALKTVTGAISKMHRPPILIKGMALLEDLYNDMGARSMSDIDIIINRDSAATLNDILLGSGWRVLPFYKWEYNKNKINYLFEKGTWSCDIEVHIQDTWYWDTDLVPSQRVPGFFKLSPSLNLSYLADHFARHTFMSAHWLVDIYLFSKKYPEIYRNVIILGKSKKFKLVNEAVKCIDSNSFGFLNALVNKRFLYAPRGDKLRYYTLKHLLSPSLMESLRYDFLWLWQQGWKQKN